MDLSKEPTLVGLSLSLCIRDVLDGKVGLDQVEKIVAGTRMETEDHVDDVIVKYQRLYWSKDPDRADRIVRALWALGKIEQPRVTIGRYMAPDISSGHWVRSVNEITLTSMARHWRDQS